MPASRTSWQRRRRGRRWPARRVSGAGGDDRLDLALVRQAMPFAPCATASDDVALIAFTSGTTGVPKGCLHFHRDVMAMCTGFAAQVLGIQAGDRDIGTLHSCTFGLGGLLCFPLAARRTAVLLERAHPSRSSRRSPPPAPRSTLRRPPSTARWRSPSGSIPVRSPGRCVPASRRARPFRMRPARSGGTPPASRCWTALAPRN